MAPRTLTVTNPILPGFNADPAIARRGDDFYIATSTFEWMPAVQFHRSTNLRDWRLAGHAITSDVLALRGVPASCGVWAPCLTVEPETGRFFLAFSVMKSQSAEVFDADNYVCTADAIEGPWSDPVYVNSVGFDGSVFHEDDGTKWFITLEWETRPGREHPGWIVAQQFDPATGATDDPVRIHQGTTARGCLEAPHLYKVDGTYYLMTAEGGTGYGHAVALARSASITGPFEPDPDGAFLSSHIDEYQARGHRDFLRPERFAPDAPMQKTGHGSLVDDGHGNWYVAHLASRPLPGTLSCILGREANLQPAVWREGWLRMRHGGKMPLATFEVEARSEGDGTVSEDKGSDSWNFSTDFTGGIPPRLAAPRVPANESWVTTGNTGALIRGRDSLHSPFDVSLLATRRHGFTGQAMTSVDFAPTHFRQSAGLVAYYDIHNFAYLRLSWSEDLASRVLGVVIARRGSQEDAVLEEIAVGPGELEMRVAFNLGELRFSWRRPAGTWSAIGGAIDASFLSDDAAYGFTGQHIAIAASDAVRHQALARFARLDIEYTN